jgi:hypothetical protein
MFPPDPVLLLRSLNPVARYRMPLRLLWRIVLRSGGPKAL